MPTLSHLANTIPRGVIRGLEPLSNQAKESGLRVLHLNIGQPDISSPIESIAAMKAYDQRIIAYGSSNGLPILKSSLVRYYERKGVQITEEQVIVTNGASEAIFLTLLAILDAGSEVIIPEPFYANFSIFVQMAGGQTIPVTSVKEDGYSLPSKEEIEKSITSKSKILLLNNPCNPTGYVYSESEIRMVAEIAKENDLFLMVDEVYSDFVFGDKPFFSALELEDMADRVIICDSSSKKYSLCGARVGNIVTKNKELFTAISRMCQARLSPPVLGQLAAKAAYDSDGKYLQNAVAEYKRRRDTMMGLLRDIKGVQCSQSEGAFYLILTLPVENSFDFCKWLLTDFEHKGHTIMMSPASGFYQTPGKGDNEVRLAYVICEEDLHLAAECLSLALEKYRFVAKN